MRARDKKLARRVVPCQGSVPIVIIFACTTDVKEIEFEQASTIVGVRARRSGTIDGCAHFRSSTQPAQDRSCGAQNAAR
jgi:hypothetical protein